MNTSINLLIKNSTGNDRILARLRVLRLVAICFLFTIGFVSIVLFLLLAVSPLKSLQAEESKYLTKLSTYHPQMAKLLATKSRLSTIDEIISSRPQLDASLTLLSSQLPEDLAITGVTLDKTICDITVSGNSLESIQTFLGRVQSLHDEKKNINDITLTSLSVAEADSVRTYTAKVSMTFL